VDTASGIGGRRFQRQEATPQRRDRRTTDGSGGRDPSKPEIGGATVRHGVQAAWQSVGARLPKGPRCNAGPQGRLVSERDGTTRSFPVRHDRSDAFFRNWGGNGGASASGSICEGQRGGPKIQLRQRIAQLEDEARGLWGVQAAKDRVNRINPARIGVSVTCGEKLIPESTVLRCWSAKQRV